MRINLLSSYATTASFLFQSVHGREGSSLLRGGGDGLVGQVHEDVQRVPRGGQRVERYLQNNTIASSTANAASPVASPVANAADVANYSPDVVTEWNRALLAAVRATSTSPPKASRAMAMVHLAMFEAINGIDGKYDRYHVVGSPASGASRIAAAATAAHRVLSVLFPTQISSFNVQLTTSLSLVPSASLASGRDWGLICGNDVLSIRSNDNSDLVIGYASPGIDPGYWKSTPPAYASPLLPIWPQVLPFAMGTSSELRPPGPPSLSSQEYAIAYDEVKNVGNKTSALRTPEMSQIALFWADGGGTETPPGHWLRIASEVSVSRGMPTLERARLLALMGLGVADAAIMCWDAKYHYHHWRPVTAIRAGSTDGNVGTIEDATFLPFIGTPPFPAYTSGHSTFSGTSSRIMARILGTDYVSFTSTSDGLANVTRSYTSLSSAADEAGQSRIYGGIHFQYDNRDGLSSGRALGDLVVDGFLRRRGDLNGDGCVDDDDLGILISQIGVTGPSRADLNGDGIVNGVDRAMFAPFKDYASCVTRSMSATAAGGEDTEDLDEDEDDDEDGQSEDEDGQSEDEDEGFFN